MSYHQIIRPAPDRERGGGVGGRCLILVSSNTIRSLRQILASVFDLTGGPGERSRPGGVSGGSELPSIIRGVWERELSARVVGMEAEPTNSHAARKSRPAFDLVAALLTRQRASLRFEESFIQRMDKTAGARRADRKKASRRRHGRMV